MHPHCACMYACGYVCGVYIMCLHVPVNTTTLIDSRGCLKTYNVD